MASPTAPAKYANILTVYWKDYLFRFAKHLRELAKGALNFHTPGV
jgi:hypothetical protein